MLTPKNNFQIVMLSICLISLFAIAETKAATLTVTNLNDSGEGSFRQAIIAANANPDEDVIDFQKGLSGVVNLQSALPDLASNMIINGTGANLLTVRRDAVIAYRIFTILSGFTITINDLSLQNGLAPAVRVDPKYTVSQGGAIYNEGILTLNNCVLSNNRASGSQKLGGAIYNRSVLNVNHSAIINNSVSSNIFCPICYKHGGGIYNHGTAIITNSTISGNSAEFGLGAGIYNQFSRLVVTETTITNNDKYGVAGYFIGSQTFFRNNIIAGNLPDSEWDISLLLNDQSLPTFLFNIVGKATTIGNYGLANGVNGNLVGTISAPIDPQLLPLGNYGGTTPTHQLLSSSPAINSASQEIYSATDQRGVVRPVGGRADIGATEFNLTPHKFLPKAGLNANYNQTVRAFANSPSADFVFSVSAGSLPPGLFLVQTSNQTASISGVPTATGTFNFTVIAQNSSGFTVTANYSLIVQNSISNVSVGGKVLTPEGRGIRKAIVQLIDENGNIIDQRITNSFGYYNFANVQADETYTFNVVDKKRIFAHQTVTISQTLNNLNFVSEF